MQNRFPLPNDVFFSLLTHLPIQDILNLSLVSKEQYKTIFTPSLWKQLELRDFYFNSASNNPIACYKNNKLGIALEKERYTDYMTALSLITCAVEEEPGYTSLSETTRQYKKRTAVKEQLDNHVMQSDAALEKAYKQLSTSVESNRLIEMRTHWSGFYSLFMSTDTGHWLLSSSDNNNQNQNLTEIEDRKNKILFELAFLPLCKLDASISFNTLLNIQNILNQNEYLLFTFNYPCKKIIPHLLRSKVELNEKNWVIDGVMRMHITPIMHAALGMLEGKQLNVCKEIISQLLQNGANTKLSVMITDDDWNTEEEYHQKSKPIDEWCHFLLSNKIDSFKNKSDKNTFKETMLMIINHKPEKVMQASKRRTCSIQ